MDCIFIFGLNNNIHRKITTPGLFGGPKSPLWALPTSPNLIPLIIPPTTTTHPWGTGTYRVRHSMAW